MKLIGALTLPIFIAIILAAGLLRKTPVFDAFLEGARDGIAALIRILPALVGMMVAIEMFTASGALEALTRALSPLAKAAGIPKEAAGLALLRPVSGSASLALVDSLLGTVGADSYAGRVAAVLCGASETTFYTIAVYYGACGVSKIRHTLIAALTADFSAAVFSALFVRILM